MILIMAQGVQARWRRTNGDVELPAFKQMIPVGKYGAPIIARTQIMATTHGYTEGMVVIGKPDVSGGGHHAELPEPVGPLLSGVRGTSGLWIGRVIILLGDVVYSHNLLDYILQDKADIRFYGRSGMNHFTGKAAPELFACAFNEHMYDEILDHCNWMLERGQPIDYPPKLWSLYRLCAGFEHYDYKYEKKILHNNRDYTDDIDSPEEHKQFWDILNTEAAKDDDQCWCDLRRGELFS